MTNQHFQIADDYIEYVDGVMNAMGDDFIRSRYLGFVIVSAVTVYEISAKEIIFNFARKKHKVFGEFMEARFQRTNAKIQIDDLKNDFVRKFGVKYEKRFTKKLDTLESRTLLSERSSVKGAYKNLINWRHSFVHTGAAPNTTNYEEIKKFYNLGKNVLICLDETLTR